MDQSKYNTLLNKRILITGGTSGIGFAVAEACLESGAAQTIVSSSRQTSVDHALFRLRQSYPSRASQLSGFTCDMSDEQILESNMISLLKAATEDGMKKLDHVVHTAGDATKPRPLSQVTPEYFHSLPTVRYVAPLMLAKHLHEFINVDPRSSLTLTTGDVNARPFKGWTVGFAYATFGVGLMRALCLELAPVRVNSVAPAFVDTEMWDPAAREEGRTKAGEKFDGMRAAVAKSMTTGRTVGPEVIAQAYLYLMRDENVVAACISTQGGTGLLGPLSH